MERDVVTVLGFAGMFVLMALRVPIGIAMGVVGVLGFGALTSMGPALNLLGNVPLSVLSDYNLAVIPMFILMGAFASQSGMSTELFTAGRAWFGQAAAAAWPTRASPRAVVSRRSTVRRWRRRRR